MSVKRFRNKSRNLKRKYKKYRFSKRKGLKRSQSKKTKVRRKRTRRLKIKKYRQRGGEGVQIYDKEQLLSVFKEQFAEFKDGGKHTNITDLSILKHKVIEHYCKKLPERFYTGFACLKPDKNQIDAATTTTKAVRNPVFAVNYDHLQHMATEQRSNF